MLKSIVLLTLLYCTMVMNQEVDDIQAVANKVAKLYENQKVFGNQISQVVEGNFTFTDIVRYYSKKITKAVENDCIDIAESMLEIQTQKDYDTNLNIWLHEDKYAVNETKRQIDIIRQFVYDMKAFTYSCESQVVEKYNPESRKFQQLMFELDILKVQSNNALKSIIITDYMFTLH